MFFPLLALVPLLAAMAVVALARESMRFGYLAAGASLACLVLLFLFGLPYGSSTVTWFTVGSFAFTITATVGPLNLALLAIVFVVGALVHLYSAGFMKTLSEQRRFYLEMIGFEVAMAAFAMAGSFILLFLAWEFLSLLSYLLIGFWHVRERATRAARLAITTVLIGDLALLAAMAILWNLFSTFDFAAILAALPSHATAPLFAAGALIALAIFTKSAQFPFQEWLPEAMEGPTPVSAFLHSSTMVKAGVFTAIILLPLLSVAGLTGVILAFSIVTAVIATLSAMRETQIKKVIAYSTVQELSLMLAAVASGAVVAAIYFFIVQSFYKALLFFSAGSAMKATGEESLDRVSGLRANRLLYVSTLFGVLSVAGLVPFSGFFAAAGISSALSSNLIVYAIISLVGLGTSFFIFRWFFLASKPDRHGTTSQLGYLGLPKPMVYTAAILAVLTLAGSAAFFYLPAFLSSTGVAYLAASIPLSFGVVDGALVTALFAAGAVLSFIAYGRARAQRTPGKVRVLAKVAYTHRVFIFAYGLCAAFLHEISEGVGVFERYLDDGFVLLGRATMAAGRKLRLVSVGSVNPYVIISAAGVVALLALAYLVL